MMHQVPDCMKFKKLQRRLGASRVVTAGTLELLWISTQKNTPQGDIGKFSNEEIAIECDWEGDADLLVSALVDCGWLEPCNEHRLVVHDWHEHAPGWIKRQLARHQKSFVTGSSLLTVTDDTQEATPKEKKPNLTQPKETKPKDLKLQKCNAFDAFWKKYPPRHGRKNEKRKAKTAFDKIKPEAYPDLRQALSNLCESVAREDTLPKDAFRWLRDGTWQEWLKKPERPPDSIRPAGTKQGIVDPSEVTVDMVTG